MDVTMLPDGDTGIMGHTTGHDGLGPFDDTLVLWWLGDASSCCKHRKSLLLSAYSAVLYLNFPSEIRVNARIMPYL